MIIAKQVLLIAISLCTASEDVRSPPTQTTQSVYVTPDVLRSSGLTEQYELLRRESTSAQTMPTIRHHDGKNMSFSVTSTPKGLESLSAVVINLDRRSDRWKNISRSLSEHAPWLRVRRISAVDGAVNPPNVSDVTTYWSTAKLAGLFSSYVPRTINMSPGERGCCASHMQAWRVAAAGQRPLVVLEDDAVILPSFSATVATAMRERPERVGAIWLSSKDRGKPKPFGDVLRVPEFVWTTVGYIIWPDAAQKFLGMRPIDQPVDNFMGWHIFQGDVNALSVRQSAVEQANTWNIASDVLHSDVGASGPADLGHTDGLLVDLAEQLPPQVESWYNEWDAKCRSKKEPCITKRLVQQHESLDIVLQDLYQRQAHESAVENTRASGWEYIFFTRETREEHLRESALWKNTGLLVTECHECGSGRRMQLVPNLSEVGSSVSGQSVLHRVPLVDLFGLLIHGVTQSDLFKYMIVYEFGGVYFDSKAGVQYSEARGDTAYTYEEVFHEMGDSPFWLSHWNLGQKGQYLGCGRKTELIQWFLAAHPRHRYLWRVIELVAAQIYVLATKGDFASQIVQAGCPEWHNTYARMWDRGMKVLLLTGPIAFTNAIWLEQQRMKRDGLPASGTQVYLPNDAKDGPLRYCNARWPAQISLDILRLKPGARPGDWVQWGASLRPVSWGAQDSPLVRELPQ